MRKNFKNIFKNKKVLVTGHTGFKGSWLTLWLLSLGAKVYGISKDFVSEPCNFNVLNIRNRIEHCEIDIRDIKKLKKIFLKVEPDIVFHLAAQALVKEAYLNPKITFDTNVGGTINILECIKICDSIKAALFITSDKCYHNCEWTWGYRENDRLGGEDPYSASKACAEVAINAYLKSFFSNKNNQVHIATARAGNVIGGGDWASNRIIPDCVRALSNGEKIVIRNPNATRPWQHVLEPLSGYLWLCANLVESDKFHGESFNFGPKANVNMTVEDMINKFISLWGEGEWEKDRNINEEKENILLKLSCDKAMHYLKWSANLDFLETMEFTARWYQKYYQKNNNMSDYTLEQIRKYVDKAKKKNYIWCS